MSFIAAAAISAGGMIGSAALSGDGGGGGGGMSSAEPKWQSKMRKKLSEQAMPKAKQRIARAGEPYPGQLTAPLSEYEELGLGSLGEYLRSELPTENPLYGLAQREMQQTLSGEYDPYEGEYYSAFRENVLR